MKIEIEPTGDFEGVNGTRCRIWEGVSDKGVKVKLAIAFVQVATADDNSAFETELREIKSSRELVYFDNRMLFD